ncbi:MAG TPA: cytochrome c oxidase assembly protein [Burkholderiales bacterium]|nr:cytochrome c oxidase assembly protein [Burkholderiales bacterium]
MEVQTVLKPEGADRAAANRRLAARFGLLAVAAFGFGFALVPIYDVVCRITGFGGRTGDQVATAAGVPVNARRLVTVEFMGNTMPGASWEFEPMQTRVAVHPGEATTVKYRVKNPTNQKVVGQAVPSVTPWQAANHLKKLDCFCFSQQDFQPGEVREMPVTFFVDPELPEDIRTLTLSYAFFSAPGSGVKQAKLNP